MQTSETDILLGYLGQQRDHVLGIIEGLDDADLRRAELPTGWTVLGMLRHLTFDIERFWFGAVVAAEPDVIVEMQAHTDVWHPGAELSGPDAVAAYRAQIVRSDAVLRRTPLDDPPAWWPADQFGDFRIGTVREIILHVMVETACHAGHLDALRELIDGRTWVVLTD